MLAHGSDRTSLSTSPSTSHPTGTDSRLSLPRLSTQAADAHRRDESTDAHVRKESTASQQAMAEVCEAAGEAEAEAEHAGRAEHEHTNGRLVSEVRLSGGSR